MAKIKPKRIYVYYVAILIVVVATFGLYFFTFHGNISNDSYAWGNFGNYINGLLTPLLTIINIAVFIDLTIAITNLEEQRSERALENERNLQKMQLRKQELETFVKQMNKMQEDYSSRKDQIKSLNQIICYLQTFEKTGFKYFELKDSGRVVVILHRLSLGIQQYVTNLEQNGDFDKELFYKIYDSKEEILKILVDSILVRDN